MTHHQHTSSQPTDPLNRWRDERNFYFTGKYLTAKDFTDEQAYTIAHHRWHQWGLHGYGILWGLEVEAEANGCLTIQCGVAVDCWGRELVVSKPVRFSAHEMPHLLRPAQAEPYWNNVEHVDVLVGLLYQTRDRDCVPVILNDERPGQSKVHGRVQEYAKIGFIDYCPDCWSIPKPFEKVWLPQLGNEHADPVHLHQHNCADEHCHCDSHATIKPPCRCGNEGFLPLTRLVRVQEGWSTDDTSCRYTQSPFFAEQLTHIIGISWHHAEDTPRSEILCASEPGKGARHQHAAIQILFDRPLHASNEALAQLVQLQWNPVDENDCDGDDQPETVNINEASLDDSRKMLRIEFPYARLHRCDTVRLRLSLNCDMLIDYRGRAVDGEHLHGQVPYWKDGVPAGGRSGDGREGGIFQSWTKVCKPS